MTKKHLVFIINPKSGNKRKKHIGTVISQYLDLNQFTYEIQYTQYPGHGTELAGAAAAAGAFAVIAVGGDGSINDILQGVLGTETALGIVPMGSGNGMARTLQLPLDARDAIQVLNRGHIVPIDIGFANGKPFISNAGVAFDALIARKFSKSANRGFLRYSWLVTKHLWSYKDWDWDIVMDGEHMRERAFIINIANGQQFGYDFKIAPSASYTDGLLDLVIVRSFPRLLGGAIALRAMQGTIDQSPYVQHRRGKEITVAHPSLRLMQTDGDALACDHSVTFTIQPAAQRVLIP
jgi:diacylglycerol kinase (ATP)